MAPQAQPVHSAPHINADILNQIRGAQQHQSNDSLYQQQQRNPVGANRNSSGGGFPTDDIQAAMAKHHHHQLHDGSFMPDQNNAMGDGQMVQGSAMLRKSQHANESGASGNNVQGQDHNNAIAESYEVKILSNPGQPEPQQQRSSANSIQQPQNSNAPLTDLDMQRRISRQQQQQQQWNNDGPNNQSMASISSTNSVIIPGEKAYQHDLKMQLKHQQQ